MLPGPATTLFQWAARMNEGAHVTAEEDALRAQMAAGFFLNAITKNPMFATYRGTDKMIQITEKHGWGNCSDVT